MATLAFAWFGLRRLLPRWSRRLALLVLLVPFAPVHAQPAAQTGAGADLFRGSGCVVCHGGYGTGGFGPKLAGDPMLAIGQFVVARILVGAAQMPPFQDRLSDQQIADLASYVRSSWGNEFGSVSAKEAAETRGLMQRAEQIRVRVSHAQQQ